MKIIKEKFQALWAWFLKDKRRFGLIVVFIIIIIAGWWLFFGRKNNQPQYQTSQVEKGTIVSTISASGKALTTSVLTINTQASGIVKNVYVKDGDKIYAGQKIAEVTLDSSGQQAFAQAYSSYLSAQKSVVDANNNYYTLQAAAFSANQKFINDAVARNLSETDPTYIQEYDAWKVAESNFLQLQNSISQANAGLTSASINFNLASGTITSPSSGTISNISLVEGMVLSGGSSSSSGSSSNTKVATIENQSNPIVQVTLSEIDVPKIKVGQKATITFDSISDKTFTGVVATVDRIGTISSNVTSYTANIKFDTASSEILPNMAATADIITQSKTDVLYVPSSAVHSQNGIYYVEVLKNGKTQQVNVETGISSSSDTEIVSGLSEGDVVVTGTISSTTSSTQSRSVFSTGGFGGGAVLRER
jgi:macrolide-specific efflux system membrane fusion protein